MSVEPRPQMEITIEARPAPRLRALPSRLLNALPAREGAFWVLFALATPKLFGPIFTIGLRRFLGPGAAGIFDEASVPYKFLDNFRNFGTGPALVYERTVSRAAANTAWTLNMIFAVIVTAVAQVLAGPITAYYGHPEVEGVFRVLSIAYVFASITSVHFYLLLRDLDYRARSIPAIGQVIAAGDIAVVFAVWGFGVGALVARELTTVIAGAILLWAIYPFRPKPELVAEHAGRLLRYGVWIGAGLTILYMSQNVDVFIGGHIIRNQSDVGFYTTSWKFAFIAASVFTTVASSMVFPSLSRIQDNMPKLRLTLLKSIRQLGLVMFPAAALLAAVAPVVIIPLLGEKYAAYRSSYLVLTLLAVYAGNRTMLSIFFEAYKSIGKPWLVWAYNTVKLAIMVPAMIYGAQHGIEGLALTYIPVQIVEFPAALWLARRVIGVSPLAVWRAARVPIVTTLLMTAATVAAEIVLLSIGLGDTPTLAVCVLVGGAVYLGSLLLFDRHLFIEARGILLRGL
ncbi:MAG: oligosaccharide flippase family protein [Chloroflexi bacterium]|nr:oligosaccharide flippase family protein [Chloroflexota bacterium]